MEHTQYFKVVFGLIWRDAAPGFEELYFIEPGAVECDDDDWLNKTALSVFSAYWNTDRLTSATALGQGRLVWLSSEKMADVDTAWRLIG